MDDHLRLYSSIGIEGFLSGPPHPLLSEYGGRLSKASDTVDDAVKSSGSAATEDPTDTVTLMSNPNPGSSSFRSWELVGTIKETPQDFVVREVLPESLIKKIPGLSQNGGINQLRVADLGDETDFPIQTIICSAARETTTNNGDNENSKVDRTDDDRKSTVARQSRPTLQPSPAETIAVYLEQVATSEYTKEQLRKSLERLHEQALDRIRVMTTQCHVDGTTNDAVDACWIPPPTFTDKASCSSFDNRSRVKNGAFHHAVRLQYPFLQFEVAPRTVPETGNCQDREDRWIRVTIGTCLDVLIPYLMDPAADMKNLITFRNRGMEGVVQNGLNEETDKGMNSGRGRSIRNGSGDDYTTMQKKGACAILRLRPTVSKDDRRKIHRLIAALDKNLDTNTVQIDEPMQDNNGNKCQGDHATVALIVTWQHRAIMRAGQKKRKRLSSKNEGTAQAGNIFCVLKKTQREHLTTIQKLSQVLRCRQSDIGFAGIKDMQAVTYQFLTLRNMNRKRVEQSNRELQKHQGGTIQLGGFYNVDFVLNTGDLEGNRFDILIRCLKRVRVHQTATSGAFGSASKVEESFKDCDMSEVHHIQHMVDRIQQSGFINFFGEQRVGPAGELQQVGVRAFDIGRAMLCQNYKAAIDLLMSGSTLRESSEVRRVRDAWIESNENPSKTLKAFSGDILPRERAVLRGLNRYPDNPLEALRFLPHNIRTFYIHAYQSFVWNHAASRRIALYGNNVVEGDLYVDKDDVGGDKVNVVSSTHDAASIRMDQVVLPVPGYNVQYPKNGVANIYQDLLDKDGVSFNKNVVIESTAKGSYRKLIVQPNDLTFELKQCQNSTNLKLSFQLPKGSFATMLLREFMLTTAFRSDAEETFLAEDRKCRGWQF